MRNSVSGTGDDSEDYEQCCEHVDKMLLLRLFGTKMPTRGAEVREVRRRRSKGGVGASGGNFDSQPAVTGGRIVRLISRMQSFIFRT